MSANGGSNEGAVNGAMSGQGGAVDTESLAGATASGGCACPAEPIRWNLGGFTVPSPAARLDCSGFHRELMQLGKVTYSCSVPIDACDEWKLELDQVLTLIAAPETRAAFAAEPTYGSLLGVEAVGWSIMLGDKSLDVSSRPCALGEAGCVDAPPDILRLLSLLERLEQRAGLQCSPECVPAPITNGTPCAERRYYYVNDNCAEAAGRSCDSGYATIEECWQAHENCGRLNPIQCGTLQGRVCPDPDDFCAQQTQGCEPEDHPARCLPRPRRCAPSTADATICGCDGVTYPSLCDALIANTGRAHAGSCE